MEIEDYYTTGDITKICKISRKALRHYEKVDLLKPGYIDPDNNRKGYFKSQLYHILFIRHLKSMQFSLNDIKKIATIENPDLTLQMLKQKQNENEIEIEKLREANNIAGQWIDALKWMSSDKYTELKDGTIKIKKIPGRNIVFSRERSSILDKESVFIRYKKFYDLIDTLNIKTISYDMVIYHDRFKNMDLNNTDWEICRVIPADIEINNPFIRSLKPCAYASILHEGPHDNILKSLKTLIKWKNEKGYKSAGSLISLYVIGYGLATNPEQFITEMLIPITKP